MAAFTIEASGVSRILSEELSDLDEEVVSYLSGMIADCEEVGDECEGLVELVSPFLESYGAADSEDEAVRLAKKLCKIMTDEGVIAKKEKSGTGRKLALPVQVSEQDNDDTWGLKSVKSKNNANSTVESISEALGNKKSLEKHQKKMEKEKKKEEAKFFREEQERIREMESEFEAASLAAENITASSTGVKSRDVNIENINISVGGGKALLEDATLRIVHGRKYGLIGRNGTGKTTLLKHISRRMIEKFPVNISIVHVEQEVVGDDTPVIEFVLSSDKERNRLLSEEKRLLDLLEKGDTGPAVANKLREVADLLISIGADSAEARARKVLSGLGFTEQMQEQPTKSLSGGWRMRVAIANALYLSPDLLLLDEPTNHLDVLSVLFLERYLQNYEKTFILVSHDRVFTNNVITDVIHLEHKQLNYYKGDINIFEQTRERQKLQQQREYDAQQSKRAHMQKFIDRFRYNANRAAMAQSRIKALNKMTLIEEVIDDPEFTFSFPEPAGELSKLIEVQDVSFGYPGPDGSPAQSMLFEHAEFNVDMTSRMVLLGANGCGKSTLLKIILEKLRPTSGYVWRDPKLRIGFFAQHHVDQLDVRLTPLEYLMHTFPGSKEDQVRPHLARYGIPADLALQRIGTMSGGQKSRVAFSKITWDRPQLLICDEPSNHLDLETNAALSMAINTFEGGVLLVTHDQYLIEMCADEFWVMQDHKLFQFKGTFLEYKKWALPDDA